MKLIYSLFLILSSICFSFSQAPVNDDCIGAINIVPVAVGSVCPTTVFSNIGATASNIGAGNTPACFKANLTERDVWFAFTVPVNKGGAYTVTLTGAGVAPIKNPQLAVYRGACVQNGLDQIGCASSPDGGTLLKTTLFGLNPGETYFIRVNDWTTGALPNSGQFSVCVSEFASVYTMGVDSVASTCSGTLYSSGGSGGNYQYNEFSTFKICPDTSHLCIRIYLDSLDTETSFDFLKIYDGADAVSGLRVENGSGVSYGLQYQIRSKCAYIVFTSDASINRKGFKLRWECSGAACNAPLSTTYANPDIIARLPFSANNTTCGDTSSLSPALCNDATFLTGKNHLYKYVSQGGECVKISVTGAQLGAGVAVFQGRPGSSGSVCLATGFTNSISPNVSIPFVRLSDPGEYYFVVSRAFACTPYSIRIDTAGCRNILPNAGFCSKALPLNGCTIAATDSVIIQQGQSDPTFMKYGTNSGCINFASRNLNYAFFYFKANADGKLGMLIRPNDTVAYRNDDIDYNVYGPIDDFNSICTYASSHQPVRSSFAPATALNLLGSSSGLTGLTDVNPFNRQAVTDTADCGQGNIPDGFVKRLGVAKGKYYLIFINDYNGVLFSLGNRGGLNLDFRGTTPGVFNTDAPNQFSVSSDTAICPGGMAKLNAAGGVSYQWSPPAGLSSTTVANPIAQPSADVTYSVRAIGTCSDTTMKVKISIFNFTPVADQTVCIGQRLRFSVGAHRYAPNTNAKWSWTATNNGLSQLDSTDTGDPLFTASVAGVTQFIVKLNTPGCNYVDTINITVLSAKAPIYSVASNKALCVGSSVAIGGAQSANYSYSWTSKPSGFSSASANPTVSPTQTTRYYLSVQDNTGGGCPLAITDSVLVSVYQIPVVFKANDTTVCKDALVQLASTPVETATAYKWTPSTGLNSDTLANPTVKAVPFLNTYVLTASNPGCTRKEMVNVTGVDFSMKISVNDSTHLCRGDTLRLSTINTLPTATFVWNSSDLKFRDSMAKSIVVSPVTATRYFVVGSTRGCTRRDSALIIVDSLPAPALTAIGPKDTTVCQGTTVILKSKSYEPIFYPNIVSKWNPSRGFLTPDSLYNAVLSADTPSTKYFRKLTNGVCVRLDSANVTVNPTIAVVITPVPPRVCLGQQVKLTASDGSSTQFKWSGPGAPMEGGNTITVNPPTAGKVTYGAQAKGPTCPGSGSVDIEVRNPPLLAVPANPVICPGDSISLNAQTFPIYTYSWTGPNGFTSAKGAPVVNSTAPGTYSVTAKDSIGCTSTATTNIQVATATLTVSPDVSACAGTLLTLTATGTSNVAGRYLWSNGQQTATININPAPGTYIYTVVYDVGCKPALTKSVNVQIAPGFFLRINPDTFGTKLVEQGTPITLNALLTGTFTSPTYTWTNNGQPAGAGPSITLNTLTDKNQVALSVASATGCKKDTSLTIVYRVPKYQIPNAFTPNGDNRNDSFRIIFDSTPPFDPSSAEAHPRLWKGNIKLQSFQVYDRWGQPVYEETDASKLNTGNAGWNGKKGGLPDGAELASDVYVYIIKLLLPDGSTKVESGEVTLIR